MKKLLKLTPLLVVPLMSAFGQENGEDLFELSPFVVSAEEDSGYYASQTLAGSRLRTSVQDVASSIQIITEDFMDDIGATDATELFLYTTGTESAGLGGNFTDYNVPSDGTSYGDEDVRLAPNFAQRIRGLARADTTRNYFNTIISSDNFNTERVEINRGANSILFGLGSPAGISNTGLAQARFGNFGEINHRMDSEGSQRWEGDFNYEVIEDKLAVRVAGLIDEQKYYQKPAFENDERIYLTLTAKPWKGGTLRSFYEDGVRKANRPSMVSPGNTMNFFFEQVPIVRERMQQSLIDGGVLDWQGNPLVIPSDYPVYAYNPFFLDYKPGGYLGSTDLDGDGSHTATDDLWKLNMLRHDNVWFPTAQQDERLVSHANASRHAILGFNWDDPLPGHTPGGTTAVETNVNSNNYSPKIVVPGGQSLPYEIDPSGNKRFGGYNYMTTIQPWRSWDPTLVPYGIQNLETYDFTKNLISGETAFQNDDWKHENIAFEQLFLDNRAGVEVVYDRQKYNRESFVPFQGYSGIFIDLMETYKGLPNPNFGRPYIQGRGTEFKEYGDVRESVRGTGFFKIDPEEIFGENRLTRWLGDHTFTGMYNTYKQSSWDSRSGEFMVADEFGSTLRSPADAPLNDRNKQMTYMVYLSDQNLTQLDSVDQVRLNPMTNQQLWQGDYDVSIMSFRPTTVEGEYNVGDLYEISAPLESYLDSYSTSSFENKSYAAIWNGSFLDGHLLGLVGYRRDEYQSLDQKARAQDGTAYDGEPNTGLPLLDQMLDDGGTFNDDGVLITKPVTTLSYSVVAHVPSKWLPETSGLTLHYGVSENSSLLSGSNRDLYGNEVASPQGETTEYGFTVSLLDKKFIARVNWFHSVLKNAEVSKNLASVYVNRGIMPVFGHLLEAEFLGNDPQWLNPETGEYEVVPTPMYDEAMDALAAFRNLIPEESIALANISNPDGMGNAVDKRENLNVDDVEDLDARGFEIELTYNPTRSWRISLNVAKAETIKQRYAPYLLDLMEKFGPYLDAETGSLRNQPFFNGYNSDPPSYIHGIERDVNTIGNELDKLVYAEYRAESTLIGSVSPEQRKWRVNFITNYKFREGFLKGFSIGGAVRWQDAVAIGYPVTLDENGLRFTDVSNPHMGPTETNIDAFLRYDRKLFDGKVDWTIEFRVQNLNTDADELIPVASNQRQEYGVAIWRAGSPRIWRISNKFKF